MIRSKANEEKIEENKVLIATEKIIQNELNDMIKAVKKELLTIDECYQILFPRIESSFLSNQTTERNNNSSSTGKQGENEDDLEDIQWESEERDVGSRDDNQEAALASLHSSLPFTLVSDHELLKQISLT